MPGMNTSCLNAEVAAFWLGLGPGLVIGFVVGAVVAASWFSVGRLASAWWLRRSTVRMQGR